MALEDEVQTRYPTQRLVELTREDNTGTIDTTKLAAACRDVEADFLLYASITFDVTEARHVALAVPAVETKLKVYAGSLSGERAAAAQKEWETKLSQLARKRNVSRIRPTCTSPYTPSDRNPSGSTTLRPPFDRQHFEDVIPGAPRTGSEEES